MNTAKKLSAKELKQMGFPASLVSMLGKDLSELIEAGYTVPELRKAGYSLRRLADWFHMYMIVQCATLSELLEGGISPDELMSESFFSGRELIDAGVPLDKVAKIAIGNGHLSDSDRSILLAEGLTEEEIRQAGY